MKLWTRLLFISIIILAFLLATTYVVLVVQGRAILIKQLEFITNKKINIGSFSLASPFRFEIKNLEIKDLAKVDSIFISPSLLGFLTGNIALNEVKIIKPELTYERFTPAATTLIETISSTDKPAIPKKKKRPIPLLIKNIQIKDGKFNFVDHAVSETGARTTVKDITLNLRNLCILPRSVITNFDIQGRIPWQEGQQEGRIEASGWINLFKKDMKATLKIEDIDGIYLYPYYSQWVDLDKARIQNAKLNFRSDITGVNNDLTANCHLELTDIVFKPRPPEEKMDKAEKIATIVLDVFKALDKGNIILNFTIKTKMDLPQVGFSDIKMAFENKLAKGIKRNALKPEDILGLPLQLLQVTFKSATDLSKAVIDGTFAVGNEIKKTAEDSFRREKKD
jgi:hypothetical protein